MSGMLLSTLHILIHLLLYELGTITIIFIITNVILHLKKLRQRKANQFSQMHDEKMATLGPRPSSLSQTPCPEQLHHYATSQCSYDLI